MKKNRNRKAFTIVELIIVIAVIGVLAAILIPTFANVVSKANAKSALADARNTLTSFIADNLDADGNAITDHIVIFVKKAGRFYVYGWTNMENDPNKGNLMKADNNDDKGYDYATLEAFITAKGATPAQYQAGNDAIAADPNAVDPYAGKLFYLLPYVAPTPSVLTKGNSNSTLDTTYNNLASKMSGDLADNIDIFDGVLCGTVASTTDTHEPPAPATYTVTYHANGGTGTMTDNTQYASGATVTVLGNTFTKSGYHFTSWNTAANGNGTTIAGSFEITQSTTLFAQWEADAAPDYSITVTLNDTWNEATSYASGTITVHAPGEYTISSADIQTIDAEFTINGSYPVVNVTATGATVSIEGTRNRTIDSELYRVITTATGIQKINTNVDVNGENSFAAEYIVNNDINLGGNNWVPIGWINGTDNTGYAMFSGVLDGNNKTLTGFAANYPIQNSVYNEVGLVSHMTAVSTVKRITIDIGSNTVMGNTYVGCITGNNNGGTISECTIIGSTGIIAGNVGINPQSECVVGGIAGVSVGTIEKCRVSVIVNAVSKAGGIVGANQLSGIIDQCIFTGGINSTNAAYADVARAVGGIAATNSSAGVISNCISQPSDLIRGNYRTSAFVGSNSGTIRSSYVIELNKVVGCGTAPDPIAPAIARVGTGSTVTNCYCISNSTDSYYDNTTQADFITMSSIPNWETTIWNITGNSLPTLKCFTN